MSLIVLVQRVAKLRSVSTMVKSALCLLLIVVSGESVGQQDPSLGGDLQSEWDRATKTVEDDAPAVMRAFAHAKERVERLFEAIGEFAEALVAMVVMLAELGELLSDANVEMFLQCVNSTVTAFPVDHPDDPFFDVCPMYCLNGNVCEDENNPNYDAEKCKICSDPCGCKGQAFIKLADLAQPCCGACSSDQWPLPSDEAALKPHESCADFERACNKGATGLRKKMTESLDQGCAVRPENEASKAFTGGSFRYLALLAVAMGSIMMVIRVTNSRKDVLEDELLAA